MTILDLLASAKEATIPSKEGFYAAWSAVPAYRERMEHEIMARSSMTIDDYILEFLRERLAELRYASKYVIRICEATVERVISVVEKD